MLANKDFQIVTRKYCIEEFLIPRKRASNRYAEEVACLCLCTPPEPPVQRSALLLSHFSQSPSNQFTLKRVLLIEIGLN
jgi:hypothetical protein